MSAIYSCETCGETHRFPMSAALCCDAISNDLDTVD